MPRSGGEAAAGKDGGRAAPYGATVLNAIDAPPTPTTVAAMPSWRSRLHPEVRAGIRTMAVMLLGYLPFGLTLGAAIGAHPDPASAWAGTLLIFGGSAHLAVVQLTAAGAAVPVVAVAALVIQSRLAVYSLSLARHWRPEPVRVRVALAATLVEPTWMVATDRYEAPGTGEDKRRFHLAAVVTLGAGWLVMVTVGMAVGPALTAGTGLSLAVPLCLLAMLVPKAGDRAARGAIVTGAVAMVLSRGLPAGTGILVAMAAGTAAGVLVDLIGRPEQDRRADPVDPVEAGGAGR
jgi:predicted branched-subunit amino acid permease